MDIDKLKTQLIKMQPQKGDIFILKVEAHDSDIINDSGVQSSIRQLAMLLQEQTGTNVPMIVLGTDTDLSMISRERLMEQLDGKEEEESTIISDFS